MEISRLKFMANWCVQNTDTVCVAQFLVTNNYVLYVYMSIVFYRELIRALRPNPKKNMLYGTLCRSWLLSRLQSRLQHIYQGQPYARVDLNPLPGSTFPQVRDLGFDLGMLIIGQPFLFCLSIWINIQFYEAAWDPLIQSYVCRRGWCFNE